MSALAWKHWTSHSCRVVDPTATEPSPSHAGDGPHRAIWRSCRGPSRRSRNLYTTTIAEVTCPKCAEYCRDHDQRLAALGVPMSVISRYFDYDADAYRYAQSSRAIGERSAWETCCRARGAPLLVRAADVARDERLWRAHMLEQFEQAARTSGTSRRLVGEIEDGVASMSPLDLEAVRSAIHEYTLIGDVLAEVGRMRARARGVIEQHVAELRKQAA